MIHQELLFYVKEQQKRGVPNASIKEVLMREGGWNEADIDEVFRFAVAPTTPLQPASVQTSTVSSVAPATSTTTTAPISQPVSSVAQKPAELVPSQPVTPISTTIGSAATIAAPLVPSMNEPKPMMSSPYAPTKAGAVPAFSGMETKVMLEKAKPRKSRAGIFAVILVVILLGGAGAYAYTNYVSPSPNVAFARGASAFAKQSTFRFSFDATSPNLSPALFSFLPAEATPTETANQEVAVDTSSKLSLSGTVAPSGTPKYTLTGSLVTPSVPVTVSVQAKTGDGGVLFQFPNLGYFIERFNLPNDTQAETWYKATGADIEEAINPGFVALRALAPLITPGANTLASVSNLLAKYPILVPTTSLPRGTDDGSSYLRYQVTVSKEALRALSLEVIKQGQGTAATAEQTASVDQMLENLTFSNGELWLAPFTFLPHRLSLTITSKAGSGLPFDSINTMLTLSGYGDAFPVEATPASTTSVRDVIDSAVTKQKDASVQSLMSQSRVEAEMFYGKRRSYYNLCKGSTELVGTFAEIKTITGTDPTCVATARAYAIATPLPSDTTKIACVDSSGTNGTVSSVPTKTVCQ